MLRHRILHNASVRRIKENSIFFNKVFGQTTNGWFFDIFVNPKGKPPYYLMFINQNTKYAVAFPMENRSSHSVLNAIQTFVKEHKVNTLVSDAERAFMSKDVVEFLISNRIELYTMVAENMKTGLSVINRFMRTLRDLIGKNRNIDEIEMRNLLKRYKRL